MEKTQITTCSGFSDETGGYVELPNSGEPIGELGGGSNTCSPNDMDRAQARARDGESEVENKTRQVSSRSSRLSSLRLDSN